MHIMIASIVFILLIGLGNVLQFIYTLYYVLAIVMVIYLCCGQWIYRSSNCRSLEAKDFIYTAGFVGVSYLILSFLNHPCSVAQISYLYLISFITILLYADSIRFKTLIS